MKLLTIPKGYYINGTHCGIKKDFKKDLGIIISEVPAICSSAYTTNLLISNSIIVSRENLLKSGQVRCVIANSGCANTATGPQGLKDTREICSYVSKKISVKKHEVVIASTGVIGELLPKQKIFIGIDNLLKRKVSNIKNFAQAIMTTDTKEKIIADRIVIDGKHVTTLCFAKGSGMIAPELDFFNRQKIKFQQKKLNHATMLIFFISDINISQVCLDKIVTEILVPKFNSFCIDGDTSPNDTVFFLANGCAKNKKINSFNSLEYKKFCNSIEKSVVEIIKQLLFDGEGVTKVVELEIKNCLVDEARKIAKTISSSLLVKTAIYGADPNWGRILSAIGRCGVSVDINKIDIWIGPYQVVKNGHNNFVSDSVVNKIMRKKFYKIVIDIKKNKFSSTYSFYTTDLSKEYVEINSKYKT